MKIVGPASIMLIIAGSIFFAWQGWHLHQTSSELKEIKEDYAEINHIKYGLLNFGLWKSQVSDLLAEQIDQFELSDQARTEIRSYIMKYLHDFYDKQIRQGEFLNQFMGASGDGTKEFEVFGFKVKVPIKEILEKEIATQLENVDVDKTLGDMADQMMAELKRNEPLIKEAIRKQMTGLLVDNKESAALGFNLDPVMSKYSCKNILDCNSAIYDKILRLESKEVNMKNNLVLLSLIPFLIFLLTGIFGSSYHLQWIVIPGLTVLSLLFLSLGLTLPMIDLYAGLDDVRVDLLGKNVDFGEQVLFFQSKSIFEVVDLLIQARQWDSKLVGILILVFSIVFPLVKTIATFLMSYIQRLRRSELVQKLALTLSKWSMADVFVVGLFMAFIGFNSLVRSQLIDLNQSGETFDLITKNKTVLRPGAIFFTGFVLISLSMSTLISLKKHNREVQI